MSEFDRGRIAEIFERGYRHGLMDAAEIVKEERWKELTADYRTRIKMPLLCERAIEAIRARIAMSREDKSGES